MEALTSKNQLTDEKSLVSFDDLPLPFRLLSSASSYGPVGTRAIVEELSSGRWDFAVLPPTPPPRSLLLTWMGSLSDRLDRPYDEIHHVEPTRVARAIIARGGSPWEKDLEGRDALDQAFAVGNVELVEEWGKSIPPENTPLAKRTCAFRNQSEMPLLHMAAIQKNTTMLKVLVALGLNPNQQDDNGNTPLFWADGEMVVKELVGLGADAAHRNNQQQSVEAFWVGVRGVPGSHAKEWARELGRKSRKALTPEDRDAHIVDFYAASTKGTRGMLAPLFNRLKLRPGEVNEEGLSPLGVSAKRELTHKNGQFSDSREKLASDSWRQWLFQETNASELVSGKDWVFQLMAAGSDEIYQTSFDRLSKLRPTPLGAPFFEQALLEIDKMATQNKSDTPATKTADYLARGILAALDQNFPLLDAKAAAVAFYSCLQICAQAKIKSNDFQRDTLEKYQNQVLQWLRKSGPTSPLLCEEAWEFALLADFSAKGKIKPLSVPLVEYLLQSQVIIPESLHPRIEYLAEHLPSDMKELTATLSALVISQTCPAALSVKRGHRL